MSLLLGTREFADVRLGDDQLSAVYVGSEKIWESQQTATIRIPAANFSQPLSALKLWAGTSPLVPSEFRDDPASQLSISRIDFQRVGLVQVNLSSANGRSRDLSSAWETRGRIRFQATGLDVTLDVVGDTSRPYRWPNGTITEAQFDAIASSDLLVTLIIPPPPPPATITLPASGYVTPSGVKRWFGTFASSPVPAAFRDDPASELYLGVITTRSALDVQIECRSNNTRSKELASSWESSGRVRFQATGLDITLDTRGDTTNPYYWLRGTLTQAQYDAITGGELTITLSIV